MNVQINTEKASDFKAVSLLIEKAFQNEEQSDHREHFLVERLRDTESFLPELSLVARMENEIVGYILLTRIKIGTHDSLALAPVAVLPRFQSQGVGSQLIEYAHQQATKLGFGSVVVLGHKDYYPRFGYQQADGFGIAVPFDVPTEYVMVKELAPNGLKGVSGTVAYDDAFYEE